ncbi:hypothetical protein BGZ97_012017 [Linnemannia gamsii]|uniref:Uncharacterized protein n=1 Tax=Linnemannia gamsii TaxID=64522 RepID=A0A9P6UL32_9FUNG|nr:hypothetical protein BGZ97_012017 [Linnemannia gamsii]
MKVAVIISLVVASALTVAVHAAPAIETTFAPPPAASTAFPPPPTSTPIGGGSSRNGTGPATGRGQPFTITDDSVLRDAIVDYDYEDAAKYIAQYYKAVYGDRIAPRTNGVSSRAAASKDILPFCVGVAFEPSRVQIFKNKMSCDANGWSTLFIFTAHTKQDIHHAKYPICVGWATAPNRSMLFSSKTTCSLDGFTHDFAFYESGMRINYDASVNALHESTVMWQARTPHRMMLYPYYEGDKHGWQQAYNLQYRSRYRLASSYERAELTIQQGDHEEVHKKLSIATPNTAASRCTLNLIQMWTENTVNTGNPISKAGSGDARYVADAQRDECSNLVATSFIRVARVTVRNASSLEAVIGGKIYAAASVSGNTALSPAYVRIALQESLRTGRPVMVARQRDKSIPDSVVALIDDTFVTIGGKQVYGAAI